MASLIGFLLIWILLTGYVLGQYSINLRLNPSTPTIRASGRVEAICEVTTSLNNSVKLVWIKKTGNGGGGGLAAEEKEIATNTQLSHEFKNNRYHVSEQVIQSNAKYRFTLTITDLQASDSGEIGCEIPSNNIEVFRPLIVHVPAKSVRLSSKDLDNTHAVVYSNEQEVSLKEGETRKLFCHVQGAYPEPRVRILLGGKDITDRFQKTSTSVKTGNGASKDLSYKVQLANQALDITYDFSGKELKCIAEVNGKDAESTSTSIRINLQGYRPKFECPSEVKVKLHQANVELRCSVSAQPEVSHVKFHWKRHTTGNESIEAGQTDGTYEGNFQPKPGDESSKEMVLRINRVFPQHYRAYYFEAENAEGKTIHRIELTRDGPQHKLNGASRVFPSYAAIATIILYSVLSQ